MSLQPLVTTRGACDIPPDSKICPDACLAALKQIKSVADEVRFCLLWCASFGVYRGPRDGCALLLCAMRLQQCCGVCICRRARKLVGSVQQCYNCAALVSLAVAIQGWPRCCLPI